VDRAEQDGDEWVHLIEERLFCSGDGKQRQAGRVQNQNHVARNDRNVPVGEENNRRARETPWRK
jgi:hypothetical protein